jgi:hypothetical protein
MVGRVAEAVDKLLLRLLLLLLLAERLDDFARRIVRTSWYYGFLQN